jgi:16S rRNA C1402 (ribose-2'-O) methylase RsmI
MGLRQTLCKFQLASAFENAISSSSLQSTTLTFAGFDLMTHRQRRQYHFHVARARLIKFLCSPGGLEVVRSNPARVEGASF